MKEKISSIKTKLKDSPMALSDEFKEFYRTWLKKAEQYKTDICDERVALRNCFDKFFTLFVIYNRLYAESTFLLARQGALDLSKWNHFRDAEAAQDYVLQYVCCSKIIEALENDPDTNSGLEEIIRLIEIKAVYVKLDMITGDIQEPEDEKLLERLRSKNKHCRAKAVLEVIYSTRCNMFHGHKGFDKVQIKLLKPIIIILKRIICILYDKLAVENQCCHFVQ